MTKILYLKIYFAKIAMFQTILGGGLIQAPNMFKHISRNRGATNKSSRKTAHNKKKLFWGKKAIFPPKNGSSTKKKL